jgi:AraC-like DNA-binding protein
MKLFSFFSNLFTKSVLSNNTDKKTFDHYFFDLKYYIIPSASQADFSSLLGISKERVDYLSRTFYNFTFTDLIYEYRYNHFMLELESPYNTNLSIESVIKLCGFESNENFAKYVKEKHENFKK